MADSPENPGTNSPYTSPAPPPFQPVTPSFQPMTGQPQPVAGPPKPGGSSAIKIILIVVAVFVCLGIMGAAVVGYGIWRVSRAVRMNHTSGESTFNIPGTTITTNSAKSYTSGELGIDIYPGAQSAKGSMNMSLPTGSMVVSNFVTSDSKDQVVAFYKSKVGSGAATMETGEGAYINWNKSSKDSVVITVTQKPSQYDGKTQIHIVHTISSKTQ